MDEAGRNGTGTLFGRADDVELLQSFIRRAAESGAALCLTGEAGVGKTALLDVTARTVTASGLRGLSAGGVEFEAEVSFAGLNQLLMPVLGELASLSQVHRDALASSLGFGPGPAVNWLVVSTAVLTLLRGIARDVPVVIVVDDLQWFDRASAEVLGFVARRLSRNRIGILAAWRSGGDVLGLPGLPVHEVQPLADGPAEDLVRDRFPTMDPRVRRRVVDAAQGNPLALLELPAALTDRQRSAVQPLPAVLPLGHHLQSLFAARVCDLPEAARRMLLLTALDGTGDVRVLRAASPGDDWLDALAPAEEARMLRVDADGRRVRLLHPLIGSAAVELATSSERRRAHGVLADVFADEPGRRAWHLAEAAVGSDERAADLLDEAAHLALGKGDGTRAVAALLRAADLSPHGPARARRLSEAAYVGASVAGELRNVPHLLNQAHRADPDGDRSLQAAVAAAYHLLNGHGDVDSAHQVLVRAIEAALRDGAEADELDEALHTLLVVCHFSGRAEAWRPLESALARLHDRLEPVISVSRQTYGAPARVTRMALQELDTVIAGIEAEADSTRIVRTGIAAFYVDRLEDCRRALWRVVWDGREGGAVASAVNALMMLCHDAYLDGRWDDARATATEGIEMSETLGYRLISLPGLYCLGLLAAAEGDEETAGDLSAQMVSWAAPRGARGIEHFASRVRALCASGAGDFEEAYREAASISAPGELADPVPVALWVAWDLVEAAVRTGRHDAAAAHVTAMQELEVYRLVPRLALLAAASAALAGPDATAPEQFERALAVPGGTRYPFEHARVQLAYGEHLRRVRATGAARLQLAAAREAFSRLGAHPWEARADHELRATGVSRSPSDRDFPVVLTPQEHEIAMLAASGLTNKQIGARLYLSPRTVSAHLYRIFPKLGIGSRAALRDALTRLPLDVDDRRSG